MCQSGWPVMAHCHYQDNNLILFCSLSQLIISTIAIFINNDISEKVKLKVVAAAIGTKPL